MKERHEIRVTITTEKTYVEQVWAEDISDAEYIAEERYKSGYYRGRVPNNTETEFEVDASCLD